MNIDLTSFAFGSTLMDGSGTPSWGTSLGQSSPDYKFTYPGSETLLIGMVYCSVPLNMVKLPIGKGGRIYTASERKECQIASLFRKVYVNGVKVDYPFIMVLFKEDSESHSGRKGIKYSDKNEYNDNNEKYSNQEFINNVRIKLNMEDDACWFVYKMEVYNQDELHMSAVIVDASDSVTYLNSSERKRKWSELIPEIEDKGIDKYVRFERESSPLQTIYYGTPGSGKSHKVKKLIEGINEDFVFRTTFHPDSDYASFVGCYKPCTYSRLLPDKGLTENQLLQNFYDSKDENKYKGEIKARYFYEYLKNAADIKRLGLTSSSIADKLRNMGFDKTTYLEASLMTKVYDWLNEDGFHTESKISYEFCPQAFTKAYVKAWQNPGEPVYLIIEEINRGNCAQIFGDLFQLLDRKDGVSEYPIDADNDLKDYLEKELGVGHDGIANGKLRLPSNLNILATMNTSDQSLFPMDSAFKRRWDWECVPVDYENVDSAKFVINIDGKDYLWHDFLKNVNARIKKATDSEDKQMGNFFITGNVTENQFVNKVMFYLWNDICKEEFGSLNNFFRNYIDEKKSETEEFSFNDLFTSDKKKLLSKFMEYIEVKSVADVQPEKSEEESE